MLVFSLFGTGHVAGDDVATKASKLVRGCGTKRKTQREKYNHPLRVYTYFIGLYRTEVHTEPPSVSSSAWLAKQILSSDASY